MKRGRNDPVYRFTIRGLALEELRRWSDYMPESYGLDRRIREYKGVRPISFLHWELDHVIEVLDEAVNDPMGYPCEFKTRRGFHYVAKDDPRCLAVVELLGRLRKAFEGPAPRK